MESTDGQSLGLEIIENLMTLAQKHRVAKVKWDKVEIEMDRSAYQQELTKEQMTQVVEQFRKTADEEDKEFERTLFYSSQSV